jgi:hypothetical protein
VDEDQPLLSVLINQDSSADVADRDEVVGVVPPFLHVNEGVVSSDTRLLSTAGIGRGMGAV